MLLLQKYIEGFEKPFIKTSLCPSNCMPAPPVSMSLRMFQKTFYRELLKDPSAEVRIDGDRVIVGFDYFDEQYLLIPLFKDMSEKLEKRGISPYIPWLGNRKLDIQFMDSV